MKRAFSVLIGIPFVIIVLVLSVANRDAVTFSIDPFTEGDGALSVTAPLFVFLFASAFVGLIVGWIVGWSGQARWRREARTLRREQKQPVASGTPAEADRPALPRP